MKAYRIRWRDAKTSHGWREKDDINLEPFVCETLGFLVQQDKRNITVAASYCKANETYAEIVTIPVECIISKKVVR